MRRVLIALACWVVVGLSPSGCGGGGDGAPAGEFEIAVSVAPLAWVARGLAPAEAAVTVLVPPGVSPHGWEPTPRQAAAMRGADLVLFVGLGIDPSVERAVEGESRGMAFAAVAGVEAEAEDHEHAAGEAHDHAVDPHLWLDPALMAALVRAAHERIGELQAARGALDDAERDRLAAARDGMLQEIERVRALGESRLAAHAGAGMVTAHDAWDRFGEAYGLRVVGVLQHRGETEPTPGAVAAAAEMARAGDARVIVVEPQLSDALARRVAAATGAAIATLDPLGSGDWPAMMAANIEALASALGGAQEQGE